MNRTPEQIKHHYSVEVQLANRLRHAPREERLTLYSSVYNELYHSVPDHPMLLQTENQSEQRSAAIGRKRRMLKPYIRETGTFMEIGAGDCGMSLSMAKAMSQVIAIEVSDAITEQVELPDNARVVIIDEPAGIPVEPESVDLAFSDQLAEHLHPEDFLQQCKNIYSALNSDGHYVLVTPNRINGPHDISRGFDTDATGMHLKEYTFTELSNMLEDIGFRSVKPIVGFKGYYMELPAVLIQWLERGLQSMPSKLADAISNTLPMQMLLAIRLVAIK